MATLTFYFSRSDSKYRYLKTLGGEDPLPLDKGVKGSVSLDGSDDLVGETKCQECREKLERSGILTAVQNLNWGEIEKLNLEEIVSFN